MAKLTMVEAISLALRQEMEKDPRVLILGEDVGKNGGVFRATQGLFTSLERRGSWTRHCRSRQSSELQSGWRFTA